MAISQETVLYETVLEVMDQVAHLDRKVSLLLAAAGIPEPGRAGSEDEMPPDLVRALAADPTLGGKLHDVHGGPGQDCWCGYAGHA